MVTPNPEFAKEIAAAGGEMVKMCFQCGTCTAGCPSGRRTSYRVRKLMRMAQLGLKDEIIASDELWECSTCYTCVERCPRQVPIVDIVVALRNISVAEGHMRPQHKGTAKNFAKIGHTVKVDDKITALRGQIGLAEVPPTVLANEKAMADVSKILALTGFDKIVQE
ncbi:MAG: CoB--CoM heterodisulfide reductase subunit C [Candidatus Methanomethylophilaceae archaeon]|nr:CoB--CoM heterodisulfide reductase subunit C [Candidatus Methanomethylophilaceae archaeon]